MLHTHVDGTLVLTSTRGISKWVTSMGTARPTSFASIQDTPMPSSAWAMVGGSGQLMLHTHVDGTLVLTSTRGISKWVTSMGTARPTSFVSIQDTPMPSSAWAMVGDSGQLMFTTHVE